jgi:Cu2+-exporting ATPase
LAEVDYGSYAIAGGDGGDSIHLMVEGLHCAACVWLIESVLKRQTGVLGARLNMTTRRLGLRWRPGETTVETIVEPITRLGYRLVPYDPSSLDRDDDRQSRALLRAMAVAGFAAGNVMLLSVAVWAGHEGGMGPATRTLFHWVSAMIALPAIAYAGRPFFRSAFAALRARRVNMDVPISLGVLLAAGISLQQTIAGADHAYFDSAISLLFFLLIGRWLDLRARGRARSAATHLLGLNARAVTVLDASGERRVLPPTRVTPGMRAITAAGERVAVDGRVIEGRSEIDTALIDGESLPKSVQPGALVFAGTLNVSAPLVIETTAVGEDTLLAQIARLTETAERDKGRYETLADRVARRYAPVVHTAALATFLGWWGLGGIDWQPALLNAIAVLIITCPCALALAVPAVQVVAQGRLLRRGILVKSGTALERLARVDVIAFDKTGTLTEGRPQLVNGDDIEPGAFLQAASLASSSRHPLARALVRAAEARSIPVVPAAGVREVVGQGLELDTPDGFIRLGRRSFCDIPDEGADASPELWLWQPPLPAVRFAFADPLRADAFAVKDDLDWREYQLIIMSGDRETAVQAVGDALAIDDWRFDLTPQDKIRHLANLASHNRLVLMVGDGLNDAPALAGAYVSMSPASAVDVTQTAADVVFQGDRLDPVRETLAVARRARRIILQNLGLAFAYNIITIPLAVGGQVTPLVAAVSMSASSVVVILNALRVGRGEW